MPLFFYKKNPESFLRKIRDDTFFPSFYQDMTLIWPKKYRKAAISMLHC
jgi:hypothetical protein